MKKLFIGLLVATMLVLCAIAVFHLLTSPQIALAREFGFPLGTALTLSETASYERNTGLSGACVLTYSMCDGQYADIKKTIAIDPDWKVYPANLSSADASLIDQVMQKVGSCEALDPVREELLKVASQTVNGLWQYKGNSALTDFELCLLLPDAESIVYIRVEG